MEIARLSRRYRVVRLGTRDLSALERLARGNPLFYRYCPPAPTLASLARDLQALPPGKTAADKYYLGFYRRAEMLAAVDLVTGYPDPDTAWIGFFMVAAEAQGRGIGSQIVAELGAALADAGYRRAGLAYARGNPQSRAFWFKNGFRPTGRETAGDGYTAVELERILTESPD